MNRAVPVGVGEPVADLWDEGCFSKYGFLKNTAGSNKRLFGPSAADVGPPAHVFVVLGAAAFPTSVAKRRLPWRVL